LLWFNGTEAITIRENLLDAAPTHINSGMQIAFRVLAERKLYTDLCAKSQPLHEAAEGADFPILDPDLVGVAWNMAKSKVTYNLDGIPVVCMTCACHVPLGVMPGKKEVMRGERERGGKRKEEREEGVERGRGKVGRGTDGWEQRVRREWKRGEGEKGKGREGELIVVTLWI